MNLYRMIFVLIMSFALCISCGGGGDDDDDDSSEDVNDDSDDDADDDSDDDANDDVNDDIDDDADDDLNDDADDDVDDDTEDTTTTTTSPTTTTTAEPTTTTTTTTTTSTTTTTNPCPGVHVNFDPDESAGFFDMPFPNNLRIEDDGTIRILDYPNPRNSSVVTRYLEEGDEEAHGFGANSGVFFTFNGAIDTSTLPASPADSMDESASAFLISIDPSADDYGTMYPVRFNFMEDATVYAPANFLVMLPVQGVALLHGATYAAVLTKDIEDSLGASIVSCPDFEDVLAGNSDNADANAVYAPLRDFLATDAFILEEEIAMATVFTTNDPIPRLLAMRDHVYGYDLPAIDASGLTVLDTHGNRYLLGGTVTVPNYQAGALPYTFTGGNIEFDGAGAPIVQNNMDIRLSLSIPKGVMPENGWPVLIYSHGSGGDYGSLDRSHGPADLLAKRGIAGVSSDAPFHGDRDLYTLDEAMLFYNALNPDSFRDNEIQAAMELMSILKRLGDLRIEQSLVPDSDASGSFDGKVGFDMQWPFFMGHSQGAIVGSVMTAVDPNLKASYFSGAGASLLWNILTKKNPVDIGQLVASLGLMLSQQETDIEFNEFHSALNVIQHVSDVVDPSSLNNYMYKRAVEGRDPKHVFQAVGITDTYVDKKCQGAFAASSYMDMVGDTLDSDAVDRITYNGGAVLADDGVTGNKTAHDGTPITAAFAQYPAPVDINEDGHFVSFEYESMRRRIACFFRTYIDNGTPTFVNLIEDEDAACE